MSFELRDHTADVGVAATGETLEDVFTALADGLAAASCEEFPDGGDRFEVTVSAESREALLFEFLDELIYLRDVRLEFPVDTEVQITNEAGEGDDEEDGDLERGNGENGEERWILEGTARGVPLSEIAAREIKAVTYSEMQLERGSAGWEAYVVFDV